MRFAVIIPTLNPGGRWLDLVASIKMQTVLPDKVLVIDSGSTDSVVFDSSAEGFSIQTIDADSFNHGGTRNMGVNICANYDFVIFLTQDAVLANEDALSNILAPFIEERVAAVCGRQLPAESAVPIATHSRIYNYPNSPYIRSVQDSTKFGLKTIFLSNSFAAYRVSTLSEVAGFPDDVIFGEDMYAAAKLLKAGHKIAYAADACVYHSHNYSFMQEFKRYFDMGVFHAHEPWIRDEFGGAEGEGVKFVTSEFKYLLKHSFWRIPEGMLRTLFRYTGFRLGLIEKWLPLWLKKSLAMNRGYFKQ